MAATPNTGKTHVRYCRLIANGYNLSGDMRTVGSFGISNDQADATGWSNGVRQWLTGQGDVMLGGFQALFSNEATATGPTLAGSHAVLSPGGDFYVSLPIGIRAAPAVGNPAFAASFANGSYTVGGGGNEPVMVNADFYGSATLTLTQNVWGVVLAAEPTLTATGQQASVDNGASSAGGYVAYLHLTQTEGAIASNTWAFIIEHSTDDSSWATLASFTADGSAITAERLEGSGTVNRYVRFAYTRTAGTARPWVTFIRK